MSTTISVLFFFVYSYPLFMAYVWIVGAIYYRMHWENKDCDDYTSPPELEMYPPVTVLIPCFNEGLLIKETISSIFKQKYPDFEVVAINDGSTDDTAEQLNELEKEYDRLRVIHLNENEGKAVALNAGAMLSDKEIIVAIDSDAILEEHAIHWLARHFAMHSPRLGAVTGNARVRNRATLIGKLQVGEFSSIIGLIKRAQRIYGRIFTVSGVIVAYSRTALERVGYWSHDIVTEDVDVSWRLQIDHWDIRYESNALCWVRMPETIKGIWSQRLRWAQGGAEVFLRYTPQLMSWRKRRMWLIWLEYIVAYFWCNVVVFIILLWAIGKVIVVPHYLKIDTITPGWEGVVLAITCIIQFAVSMGIDSKYERGLGRYYYWIVWYPIAYWGFNVLTTFVGFPKALFKKKGKRAIWKSPDRGVA